MPHTGTPPLLVPLYRSSYLPYAPAFVLTVYDEGNKSPSLLICLHMRCCQFCLQRSSPATCNVLKPAVI